MKRASTTGAWPTFEGSIHPAVFIACGCLLAVAVLLSGCGSVSSGRDGEEGSIGREPADGNWHPGLYEEGSQINPTPIKKDGEHSYEFEPEDIERAEEAPPSVREYCAGAVSEAQEVGCLSHVEEAEVP